VYTVRTRSPFCPPYVHVYVNIFHLILSGKVWWTVWPTAKENGWTREFLPLCPRKYGPIVVKEQLWDSSTPPKHTVHLWHYSFERSVGVTYVPVPGNSTWLAGTMAFLLLGTAQSPQGSRSKSARIFWVSNCTCDSSTGRMDHATDKAWLHARCIWTGAKKIRNCGRRSSPCWMIMWTSPTSSADRFENQIFVANCQTRDC
jgi:hypothetical protein